MVHHPMVYAKLLGEKIHKYQSKCWLVNTGWSGGPYGIGQRIKIGYTRKMIDALLSGDLDHVQFQTDPIFGIQFPQSCPEIPQEVLMPRNTWPDPGAYDIQALKLAAMFNRNFEIFSDVAPMKILEAGPQN